MGAKGASCSGCVRFVSKMDHFMTLDCLLCISSLLEALLNTH